MAFYNQSETLREQGRPKEAIAVLQRAQKLDSKRKLLALKTRLAQLEAGENVEEIKLEVMKRRTDEKQTEDWLITAAAIHLQDGSYRQAIDVLRAACSAMGSNQLRAIFGQDHFFRQFADDEELAEFRDEIGLE